MVEGIRDAADRMPMQEGRCEATPCAVGTATQRSYRTTTILRDTTEPEASSR